MHSFRSYLKNFEDLSDDNLIISWDAATRILVNAWKNNSIVFVAGNGGNHLNALHFATDWTKSLHAITSRPLVTVVMGENIGLNSAIGNDLNHEESIQKYVEFLGIKFDIFLLLTAGGTSKNILHAAKYARKNNILTIGLLGGTHHNNAAEFDFPVLVESDDIQTVEDYHAMFGHSVVSAILSEI